MGHCLNKFLIQNTGGYLLDYMFMDGRKRQLEMQSSVSIWEDHCSPVSCSVHKVTTPVLEIAPVPSWRHSSEIVYVGSVSLDRPCS